MDLGALGRPIAVVPADLSVKESVGPRLDDLDALKRAAEQELLLLRHRLVLRGYGMKLAVLYDPETGRVLWLRLDKYGGSTLPTWHIHIEVDPATGRFSKPDVRQTG